MLHSFEPEGSRQPRYLILGSMPSVTSLEKQEYYGFKHNRFWKIIAKAYQTPLFSYEDKLSCISKHNIALWDVIKTCEREGSLDSQIKDVECNDIEKFVTQHPELELILCNGKKSYDLYKKHFQHLALPVVCLPSTSNANQTIKEQDLMNEWIQILKK